MPHDPVKELALELENALKSKKSLSQRDIEILENLWSDIQKRIGAGRCSPEEHEVLLERLREAVQRFEVSHPSLTAVMAQVINTLTNMGV